MSIKADETTIRRIALVRQLVNFSISQGTFSGPTLNRIVAVIGLDLAVENTLRAIIASLEENYRIDVDTTFPKLVQQADQLMVDNGLGSLPDSGRIKELHHIRNDAQHNGRYPSRDEVADSRVIARGFLEAVVPQVWGKAFEAFRSSNLVRSPTSREFLEKSESALYDQDYGRAVEYANAAVSYSLSLAAKDLFPQSDFRLWRGLRPVQWNIGPTRSRLARADRDLERELDDIKRQQQSVSQAMLQGLNSIRQEFKDEFDSMQEPLLLSILGLNYAEHRDFRQIAGTVRFERNDREFDVRGRKESISKGEAESILSYCINSIVQIESRWTPSQEHDA